MIKLKEKEQALDLRKEGKSLKTISEILNVSKSSISLWVRDIPQPERFTVEYKRKKKEEHLIQISILREQIKKEKKEIKYKIDAHIKMVSETGEPLLKKERILSGSGRWMIPAPENYQGKKYIGGRYVYEHRLVIENSIGRLLEHGEIVHHKNGDKLDNRLNNLEIITQSNHVVLHSKKPIFVKIICDYCVKEFVREKRKIKYKHNFCCLSHAVSFQQKERLMVKN